METTAEFEGWTADVDGTTVEIFSPDETYAGSGRWNGASIEDCAAVLGSDQDDSDRIYSGLDKAIAAMTTGRQWMPGDRVEGGDNAEDYDTGEVVAVDGTRCEVAWDSGVRTSQDAAVLRPEGERPIEILAYDGE